MKSNMQEKPRILFLCTGNSCRSQMAEGWMRHLYGDSKVLHRGFDDPPSMTKNAGTEEEELTVYRRVRDEIRDNILNFPEMHIHGLKD